MRKVSNIDARIQTLLRERDNVLGHWSFGNERELLLAEVEGVRQGFLKITGLC